MSKELDMSWTTITKNDLFDIVTNNLISDGGVMFVNCQDVALDLIFDKAEEIGTAPWEHTKAEAIIILNHLKENGVELSLETEMWMVKSDS